MGQPAPGPVTTLSYDELDWPAGTVYPDNSAATTCYSDNQAVTRDPAGKFRKSVTDALGRLTQAVEDPVTNCGTSNPSGASYATIYTYDGRGNLLTVTQGGQSRSFTYDEVGRLKTAGSPEAGPSVNEGYGQNQNGTTSYGYDPAGNLTQRTDPRNVTTTFTYDVLGRVAQKSYSDGTTPAVTYCYDGDVSGNCAGAPNASGHNLIGHLTRVKNSVAMTDYPWYDAMGRVLQNEQSFGGGTPYVFSYTYNDAGLKTMHYPSGRTLTYGYDAGARVISVSVRILHQADHPFSSEADHPFSRETDQCSPVKSISVLR